MLSEATREQIQQLQAQLGADFGTDPGSGAPSEGLGRETCCRNTISDKDIFFGRVIHKQ